MSDDHMRPRLFGVLGWCFLACAIRVGVSRFKKNSIPGPDAIDQRLYAQPIQVETSLEPFEFKYHDKTYLVTPRASYEIWGLVVAHNDVSSLGDIYHDANAVDIKDLGLIWGDNLSKNDYKQVRFRANCYVVEWRYPSGVEFDHDQISNNHLLSGDSNVRKTIMSAKIGDQIHMKGMFFWMVPSVKILLHRSGEKKFVYYLQIANGGLMTWATIFLLLLLLKILPIPVPTLNL